MSVKEMILDSKHECMSRDEMAALQGERLVDLVNRVYNNVPFYTKKMKELGVEPGDIKGIEDIVKLPFTTKEDLRNNYPFGLRAVPQSEIVRVQGTSGTTGKLTIVPYTQKDIDVWAECVGRCMTMAGLTKEDVIHVCYGYWFVYRWTWKDFWCKKNWRYDGSYVCRKYTETDYVYGRILAQQLLHVHHHMLCILQKQLQRWARLMI